ncbi:MAG: helix-turn-helix domain-containing protein [Saprospiraceae bacterium]|nr:helix-turn-helix domain-containing protein [Saprospiraceae bacterium]
MSLSLIFPEFNRYSLPLLILVVQGYVFAGFLLHRFVKKGHYADLILAILLIITGYDRTSYVVGFMGWYDTFRNTKINYFLIDTLLLVGPLIYFYVKSITTTHFKFKRIDSWHFVLPVLYFVYRFVIYFHDKAQPGFGDTQNGVWLENVHYAVVSTFQGTIGKFSFLIYMVLSIQLFFAYREKIKQYFSNTYKVQLNWLRNFLIAICLMFLVQLVIFQIHNNIVELHWTQRWWSHFVSGVILLYLGTFGYFTDLSELFQLTTTAQGREEVKPAPLADEEVSKSVIDFEFEQEKQLIQDYMTREQPFLNPELTLAEFADGLNLSPSVVSKTINQGFEMNFKDFINSFRVEAVQELIRLGKAENLSLLGIAFEAGFNSKATFNRTFKKFTNISPSEYLAENRSKTALN